MVYLLIDNEILDFDDFDKSAFPDKFKETLNKTYGHIDFSHKNVYILSDDSVAKLCYSIRKNVFMYSNHKFLKTLNYVTAISKEDLDIILKFNIDRRMNKLKNI